MECTIQVDDIAMDRVAEVILRAIQPSNPTAQIGYSAALDLLMDWETTRYEVYSDHAGDWADHAPSTKLSKAYKSGWKYGHHPRGVPTALEIAAQAGFPLLIEDGTLLGSLTNGNTGHERIYTDTDATAQTVLFYAEFHEFGTSKMPARPFIVYPPDSVLEAAMVPIAQAIGNAIREAA